MIRNRLLRIIVINLWQYLFINYNSMTRLASSLSNSVGD